jgi:hypothetical protein
MAPEQCRDPRAATPAADVYAVGVMLYEVVTGRRPFDAPDYMSLMVRHLTEPAPRLVCPWAPRGLVALCAELLEKDPARRPAASQVAERLKELVAELAPGGRPGQSGPWPLVVAAVAGCALTLGGVLGMQTCGRGGPSPAKVDGARALRDLATRPPPADLATPPPRAPDLAQRKIPEFELPAAGKRQIPEFDIVPAGGR